MYYYFIYAVNTPKPQLSAPDQVQFSWIGVGMRGSECVLQSFLLLFYVFYWLKICFVAMLFCYITLLYSIVYLKITRIDR